MKTIYIDSDFHCHLSNDGTMREIQTDVFDGKCGEYIEGYCYRQGESGYAVYPWRPYDELAAAQEKYEQEQRIKTLEAQNAMLTECLLEISGIIYS